MNRTVGSLLRYAFAIATAIACSPALATIAFVQANSSSPSSPTSTVSVSFTSAQTAGNLNVVAIGWADSTNQVQSVSDSEGNTYVQAGTPAVLSGGARSQATYYAKNIVGAAAGANTVTVTFTGAANYPDLRVLEYSGLDATNPLDATSGGTGTGTALNSGSITTTNANDLLIGADDVEDSITTDGTNYTQRNFSADGDTVEDRVVTTAGSYSATAAQWGPAQWSMQIVAFKAAGSGGGDTQAPAAPSNPSATAASSSQINLSWTASTDNVGVTGYKVERCQGSGCNNFAQFATPTGTSYSDTGLSASTSYSYRVRATDAAGNLSSYSSTASATTQSSGGSSIAYVQGTYASPGTSVSSVSATYSSAQTAGDLNVVAIGWVDSTHTVQSITESKGNTYAVAAAPIVVSGSRSQVMYYAKNIAAASAGADTVTVTFSGAANGPDLRVLEYSGLDATSPLDTSAGTSGSGTALNTGSLTTASAPELLVSADNVQHSITGVGPGYTQRLYTGNADDDEDEIVSSSGSYSGSATQSPSGAWIMQLVAFKAAGGGGGDTQAPTAPTSPSATAVSSSQINLSWTASTDNVGVAGYKVERCQGSGCSNFAQIGTPTGTTFSDTGLAASTSYIYQVRATDAAGNLSSYSSIVSATTGTSGDSTPPTAPTGLSAVPGATVAHPSWTASTDNVGVTGYFIERCQGSGCFSFARIGTSNGVTFSDSGLTASTSYSYRVQATDAAGNLSAYSNTASTTTTTALSAPTGLTVIAASSSEIDLAWSGSSGGSGTIGYRLERCNVASCNNFAEIGAPAITSYGDPGLSPITSYSYRVRATDSVGDFSGYSTIKTYVTPAATADCSK